MLILFLVSCGINKLDSSISPEAGKAPVSGQTDTESKTVNSKSKSTVTIKSYYNEPESIKDKNTIVLGNLSNCEYVEVSIQGEIKDFEYLKLGWDSNKNELIEKETINRFSYIEKKTIVLKTSLPEGIPSEKIKWKGKKGKIYEYVIRDYGLGDNNDTEKVFEID
jgi:hypothetical protein